MWMLQLGLKVLPIPHILTTSATCHLSSAALSPMPPLPPYLSLCLPAYFGSMPAGSTRAVAWGTGGSRGWEEGKRRKAEVGVRGVGVRGAEVGGAQAGR